MKTTLVYDVETTGLLLPSVADLDKQPHIIEFALIKVVDGEIVSEHEWLINPGVPLEPVITKITGLKDEDLVDKPSFIEIISEIEKVFVGVDQLIAHNLPFDSGMLSTELRRVGRVDFVWPKEMVCTVQETLHMRGHRIKLTDLYKMMTGNELNQTHRALDDVRALVEISLKLGLI